VALVVPHFRTRESVNQTAMTSSLSSWLSTRDDATDDSSGSTTGWIELDLFGLSALLSLLCMIGIIFIERRFTKAFASADVDDASEPTDEGEEELDSAAYEEELQQPPDHQDTSETQAINE